MRIRRRKAKVVEQEDEAPPPRKRRRRATSHVTPACELQALELEKPDATSVGEQLSLDLPLMRDLVGHGGGYRGDDGIQWTMTLGTSLACAVLCRCERWWGWFPERVVLGLRATMLRDGCRGCA